MSKKPFKETGLGKFLNKAGSVLKDKTSDILSIGVKVATGNIGGAFSDVTSMLKGDDSPEAKELLSEFQLKMSQFELEMYKEENKDRDSARSREVEIKKAGGNDLMMVISGCTGLLSFMCILYVILFRKLPEGNEKLVYHLLGVVEGVSVTIFAYYFGSSKGSKDKSLLMSK